MLELDDKHGSFVIDEEEDAGILEHVSFKDLLNMVQFLSPAYRTVFNMYIVDGFTHQEIADELKRCLLNGEFEVSKPVQMFPNNTSLKGLKEREADND